MARTTTPAIKTRTANPTVNTRACTVVSLLLTPAKNSTEANNTVVRT